jgi:hypothetical protein
MKTKIPLFLLWAACATGSGAAQVSGVVKLPADWSPAEVETACQKLDVSARDESGLPTRAEVHASRSRCIYNLPGLPSGKPLSMRFSLTPRCERRESIGTLVADQTLTLDVEAGCAVSSAP